MARRGREPTRSGSLLGKKKKKNWTGAVPSLAQIDLLPCLVLWLVYSFIQTPFDLAVNLAVDPLD